MYEVEMKVRADHGRVRDALRELGASARGAITQRDTYYDAPTRDFAETDEALRVRREERGGTERARLTYKGPLIGETSKTREEYETDLGDGDAAAAILDSLGFVPVETVEKVRERFSLAEYAVTLDSVAGVGEFVEVETEASEGDVDAAREGVARTVESLGLDPDEEIRVSYLELLLERDRDRP
ncbi:class IV adenylate cyclase [Halalkalicoccus sp. NIPERK01]|uniref:class IV adenylate cyclase n=1 Tax=Halalkalicoccus sp. NIPERK01 TaxID=3053469 RepID=UPI00256EA573|nr:class IV adenylate cyclase [Halalkalicoccus sp. NIPERK01]MDL5361029.1 class IV adenylate cyclase [Halalkalicoccus sp. NIPERK01]